MHDLRYLLVGGDKRYSYLANEYLKEGKNIKVVFKKTDEGELDKIDGTLYWEESFKESDVIIFPLKISSETDFFDHKSGKKISLSKCLDHITSDKIVFGGAISKIDLEFFKNKNIDIIDYFKREELAVLNSLPTAEGAVEIAMRSLPITIYNSRCLVTGFGRVGKAMAKILDSLGAKVTVVARKQEDLAQAKILGYDFCNINNLKKSVLDKDIIFNTVPSVIIDKDVLLNIRNDCLIIDLASEPGGLDFKMAEAMNKKVNWALALPGKVAPKTAGLMIKEVIDNMISEIYCE